MSILTRHPWPWIKSYENNCFYIQDKNGQIVWSGNPDTISDLVDFANILQGKVNDAMEVLKEFVGAYPGGINPDLDAACNKARDFLES